MNSTSLKKALENLRENVIAKINSISRYSNPWIAIKTSGVDPLGEHGIYNAGYFRMQAGIRITESLSVIRPYTTLTPVAIDMSNAEYVRGDAFANERSISMFATGSYTPFGVDKEDYALCLGNVLKRLLLSETFNYTPYFLYYGPYNADAGLYLSKHHTSINSSWAGNGTSDNTQTLHVVCPKGSDVPYFLNVFTLTVSDMVGIFNNMVDRSHEDSVAYITLGSTNLSKLTDAQKNIAYAKGWSLQ